MASSTSPAAPAKGMIQSPANPHLSPCRERACPFRAAAPTTWNNVGRIRNTFANSPNVGVCRSVCRRKGSGCGFARRDPKTDVLLRGTPRTAFPTGGCHIIKKAPASPIPRARNPKEAQSPKNRKNPVAYFGKQRYNTKRKRNQRQDMAGASPPCPCAK